jgi:hypothetical protein
MKQIYERHHVDTLYVNSNYKAALLELESCGKIKTNRKDRKARKGFFPNDLLVTFPKKRRLIK